LLSTHATQAFYTPVANLLKMADKQLLAQTMAYLLCTTPDTTLGKLLNFCLAAKIDPKNSGKAPITCAEELLAQPENLAKWLEEVIDSDNKYSVDELLAVSEIRLRDGDPKALVEEFLAEAKSVDIHGF